MMSKLPRKPNVKYVKFSIFESCSSRGGWCTRRTGPLPRPADMDFQRDERVEKLLSEGQSGRYLGKIPPGTTGTAGKIRDSLLVHAVRARSLARPAEASRKLRSLCMRGRQGRSAEIISQALRKARLGADEAEAGAQGGADKQSFEPLDKKEEHWGVPGIPTARCTHLHLLCQRWCHARPRDRAARLTAAPARARQLGAPRVARVQRLRVRARRRAALALHRSEAA